MERKSKQSGVEYFNIRYSLFDVDNNNKEGNPVYINIQ